MLIIVKKYSTAKIYYQNGQYTTETLQFSTTETIGYNKAHVLYSCKNITTVQIWYTKFEKIGCPGNQSQSGQPFIFIGIVEDVQEMISKDHSASICNVSHWICMICNILPSFWSPHVSIPIQAYPDR